MGFGTDAKGVAAFALVRLAARRPRLASTSRRRSATSSRSAPRSAPSAACSRASWARPASCTRSAATASARRRSAASAADRHAGAGARGRHGSPPRSIIARLPHASSPRALFDVFVWSGVIGTLILLVAYILATLGAMRLLWFRGRAPRRPMWQIVVPIAALLVLLATLYYNVDPDAPKAARWNYYTAGIWVLVGVVLVLALPGLADRVGEGLAAARGPVAGHRRRGETDRRWPMLRRRARPDDRVLRQQRHPALADGPVRPARGGVRARRGDHDAVPGVPRRTTGSPSRTSRSRTPSGDLRLLATPERVVPLAGQPAFAWTPGRQFEQDGSRSPYCQRGALERTVERAAAAGLEVRAGFELEWFIGHADDELVAGPPRAGLRAARDARRSTSSARSCWPTSRPTASWSASCTPSTASPRWSSRSAPPIPWRPPTCSCSPARRSTRRPARHGLRASFAPLVTPEAAGQRLARRTARVLRDGAQPARGRRPARRA